MTHHVSEAYKRHRRGTWIGALGVLAAVTAVGLMIVLPAFAGAPIGWPSGAGVNPTEESIGGSNFSCSGNPVQAGGTYRQYQISKPTAGVYTDAATGVTFRLTNDQPGKDRQKYFSFSVSGADVFHVGVNGGTNTAWYDYPAFGLTNGVTSDTNLHATVDNKGTLYTASITTFCFKPRFADIGGVVFNDRNQDGDYDTTTSPPDELQPGWRVSLYRSGSLYGSPTTSGTNGRYVFAGVPVGSDYRVCLAAPSSDSTHWSQTTPTGNACPSPLSAGHVLNNLQSNSLNNDFGNIATVTLPCSGDDAARFATTTSGGNTYSVQLAGGSLCGKEDTTEYVFQLYGSDTRVADFHPLSSGGQVHLVEKMTWTFSGTDQPDPASRSLKYDDIAPYGNLTGDNPVRPMPYCLKDPRLSGGGELVLDPANLTGVLPPGSPGHTSCLITSTESAGGTRVDISYSNIDGYRLFP